MEPNENMGMLEKQHSYKELPEDTDSKEFRERTLPIIHRELESQLEILKDIIEKKDFDQLGYFMLQIPNVLNRLVVDLGEGIDISSTPDTAIVHALGVVIWKKPVDAQFIQFDVVPELRDLLIKGKIDMKRFSEGVYFLEVLTHKFRDGNGRVARMMKLLIDKASTDSKITSEETRKVLGIDSGEKINKIDINPDFERLISGVTNFAVHKGLSEEIVRNEFKLDKIVPEKGLEILSTKLGIDKEELRREFILFMTVDSDLVWCNFSS